MNKFESSLITREFQKQIKAYLPEELTKIIVGVSGGPDSMALLYLLHRHKIPAIAVHCNYQLRGKASDQDQRLVEEICQLWDVDCVSVKLDPEESEGFNFQAWARDRRYQVFRDLKVEHNASLIATAHHEDDQIETILQKIMRGAGLSAWKGMDVLDGDLFRPLLNLSRSEIMQFIQEFNVPYRMDRSNEESTYARNFIRNNWFPSLNELFPGWKNNLLKLPERAEEFQRMTEKILADVSDHPLMMNRESFLALNPAIRPVIFQNFIQKSGLNIDLSRGFLEDIDQLEHLQSGKIMVISEKYQIIRDRHQFKLMDRCTFDITPVRLSKDDIEFGFSDGSYKLELQPSAESFSDETLYLDASKIKFPVLLRPWIDGDSIQPFGMEGSQLISDHLTNRKIPSSEKRKAKVLHAFDGTICAVIFPPKFDNIQPGTISEQVRCTPETKKMLTIRRI
jgi:tRNA(Ile)-lysidine synthase